MHGLTLHELLLVHLPLPTEHGCMIELGLAIISQMADGGFEGMR